MNALMEELGLSVEAAHAAFKLIDRKAKMEKAAFSKALEEAVGGKAAELEDILGSHDLSEFIERAPTALKTHPALLELEQVLLGLSTAGIANIRFSPSLMRGFDYYTGVVFELFDTDPSNRRSLFGGGRYDDLLAIFGKETVPAVGFGMGDVTLQDFLEVHSLLPQYVSRTELYICHADEKAAGIITEIATELRSKGVNVSLDLSTRAVGKQIEYADKQHIPYVLVIGEREIASDA